MTTTTAPAQKETVNMKLVNTGRMNFIGTMKHGDHIVAVMADTTVATQAIIASNQKALASRNRMAFAAAAGTIGSANVGGPGIIYLRADELEKRKKEATGADKETFKRAIERVVERTTEEATAPLAGHARTISAVRVGGQVGASTK